MNAEKNLRALETQVQDMSSKLDESRQVMADQGAQKSRGDQQNAELQRQLEEAESQLSQLAKIKQQLTSQLEEARHNLEDESRVSVL